MMKINIVGDFRAKNPGGVFFSQDLSAQLAQANYNIVNFEAPVECDAKPQPKSGPVLAQPMGSVRLLKSQGFNVFLLGNNHTMDYGNDGCLATLDALKDAITVGSGTASEAYTMKVLSANGIRIGLLSLVQREFGAIEYDEKCIGVAWIGSKCVEDIIKKAHDEVDYLFVFPHAGLELVDVPLPCWRDKYKQLIDCGADGVFGSHPHTPQGWEVYKGKHIFYSLGNFYFDGVGSCYPHWCESLMITLSIETNKGGYHVDVKPVVFNSSGNIAFDLSIKTSEHIKHLNDLLADDEAYDEYVGEKCREVYRGYRYGILRSVCGTSLKLGIKYFTRLTALMLFNKSDEAYLLNVLQCETHRYVAERALHDKLKL